MTKFKKADLSEVEQSEYLKGLPAIPDEWNKKEDELSPDDLQRIQNEKLMTSTYISSGYTTPASIPERMLKPSTPKKLSMLKQWENEIRKQPIDKRKRQLKLLFVQYLNKYAVNPYKYIAHPKQIKNLPSWFEDAIVLFGSDEITEEEKKGIRGFFHDLIRWRDTQVDFGQEKVDEQNRQYGTEMSPYNPEGLTPEEVDTIVSTGEMKDIDIEALRKGVDVGREATSEIEEEGAPIRSEGIATPEFGGPSIFEGEPEQETLAPSPFPEERERPIQQPTIQQSPPKKIEPVIVPPKTRPVAGTRPGNLARIISGGGLDIGTAPSASVASLDRYMIGSKKIRPVANRARKRPGKKAQMKAATVIGGLGRMDIGRSIPRIEPGMSVLGTPFPAPYGRTRNRIKFPDTQKVDGKEFWQVKIHGLTDNISGSEKKTSDMVTKLIGGTKKSLNLTITPAYIRRASSDMKVATSGAVAAIPKMPRPIKAGDSIIRERNILSGAVAGVRGIVRGPTVTSHDFNIPDMSPVKYDFGLVRKNKIDFMRKRRKEQLDEYVDYVEEEY